MARVQPTTTRPNPTQFRPLSVDQLNAIECLIAGQTDLEASAIVGCARTTISEWRHNPLFVATLNARRAELWEVPQARLLALVNNAVENIAGAIEGGDVKARVELLKAIGLYGVSPTLGSTDPHALMKSPGGGACRPGMHPRYHGDVLNRSGAAGALSTDARDRSRGVGTLWRVMIP